jgi:hypothetical protein
MALFGLHHSWIGLSLRRFSAGGRLIPLLTPNAACKVFRDSN